jgi:hypothetical protein
VPALSPTSGEDDVPTKKRDPEPPYPPDVRRARRAEAIEAAREWRDEQRERMPLPKKDQLITIRWPDGPHDFVMRFLYEDSTMLGGAPEWRWLHGQIVEPDSWHGRRWSLMVRWVFSRDDEGNDTSAWTMLPKGGKISDVTGEVNRG